MVENIFQNFSYGDDDVTNNVKFFWKIMRKMAKTCFFLKLTSWQLEKRFSKSSFESPDNIQIEYI